jgi:dUTP pyrophosphatase
MSDSMKIIYKSHIAEHNQKIVLDPFPNSGFDLLVPYDVVFDTYFKTVLVIHGVKSEMLYYNTNSKLFEHSAFTMEPRSSISKTPLMMANHIGIIDSGYRGNLIAAVRYLPGSEEPTYKLESKSRLFQICHPSLCPIFVLMVSENELSNTSRGEGGFGSTGV